MTSVAAILFDKIKYLNKKYEILILTFYALHSSYYAQDKKNLHILNFLNIYL